MAHKRRFTRLALGLALLLVASSAAADVVAVVSSRSLVKSVSKSELQEIFLGKMSRYPDGGVAVPVDLAEGSPVRNEFYELHFGKSPAQIKAYWSKIIFTGRGQPPKAVSTSVEMKKRLAENVTAVGYIERSAVDNSVRVVGEM